MRIAVGAAGTSARLTWCLSLRTASSRSPVVVCGMPCVLSLSVCHSSRLLDDSHVDVLTAMPGPCCLSQLTDRGLCRIHVHDWCVLIDLVDSSCRFPSTSHLFPSIHLALFGFRLSPNAVKASNFSFLRFLLAILWFEQPQSKPHYRPWRLCLYCLCSSFHTSAVPSCGRLSRRVT